MNREEATVFTHEITRTLEETIRSLLEHDCDDVSKASAGLVVARLKRDRARLSAAGRTS